MIGKRTFEGVDGMAMVDEPCPITYFPDDENTEVRRLTRTKDGEPIFFVDYVLRDETFYALYIEVTPEYRGQNWVQYLNFNKEAFEKGYSEFGKYTKTVWVNTSSFAHASLEMALERRVQLSQEGFLDQGEIFVQGSMMEYVDTREQE